MGKLTTLCAALLLLAALPASGGETTPPSLYRPVVAGLFYPADKKALDEKVEAFLSTAKTDTRPLSSHIFGIIAPHAGYEYSGKMAGVAYSQIRNRPYRTVILLGPSHYVAFQGVAIYPAGEWETPLGKVAVDEKTAAAIMKECNFVRFFPPAFEREHSVEVQVPFLQKSLSQFKIVPLVMGRMGAGEYTTLVESLSRIVRKSREAVLIVASSDMSHYHAYDDASRMDRATLRLIETMDVKRLAKNIDNGASELCGAQAVITLMQVAEKVNGTPAVLGYMNSGDVTQDRKRVVGYGAVAFSLVDESSLTKGDRKVLLNLARRTLEAHVTGKGPPQFSSENKRLMEKRGVFVTLQKGGALRGCIGYVQGAVPLAEAVPQMTISASSRDPRFSPVSAEELKSIHIEISVLTPLKPVKDVKEIQVGKHGLFIARGDRAGLLLPQVATEHGWGREEFLTQTCYKAGLPPSAWQEGDTTIYSFSAEVFSE